MEYNLPSEIVKDLNFGDQAKEKIIRQNSLIKFNLI